MLHFSQNIFLDSLFCRYQDIKPLFNDGKFLGGMGYNNIDELLQNEYEHRRMSS